MNATPADDARSADDPTLRTLLRTADAHPYDIGPDGKTCGCGWERPYPMPEGITINAAHAAHVATEQAAALRATERAAPEVEGLRERIETAIAFDFEGRGEAWPGGDALAYYASVAAERAVLALLAAQPTVAEVKARTLRELANDIDPTGYGWTDVQSAERFRQRLHDRADRIGGGA